MTWSMVTQQWPQYLESHIAFDIALGVVVTMLFLSALSHLIKLPVRVMKNQQTMQYLGHLKSEAASNASKTSKDAKAQIDKLWEYSLHEDSVFNERQNFFLLFESILLGGAFTVFALANQAPSDELQYVVQGAALIGTISTLAWWYMQMRQEYIIDCMSQFHRYLTPAYDKLITPVRKRPYFITQGFILASGFPIAVGIMWAFLLFRM